MSMIPMPVADSTFAAKVENSKKLRESFTLDDSGTPDEKELAHKVRRLFQQARDAKSDRVSQWNRNSEILANRTWLTGRPRWMPSPEVPEIYPILASIVGWITDSRPTFDAIPHAAPGTDFWNFWLELADDLTTCVSANFIGQTQEREIEKVVWDGYTCGAGIVKTAWDQSLDGGLGNVALNRVNPYHFFVDPHATSLEDASYMMEVRTMSLQELDRRYPGAAKNRDVLYFSRENQDEDQTERPQAQIPMANPGSLDGVHHPQWGLPGQTRQHVDAIDGPPVSVIECWVREHAHVPNDDPNAAYPTKTREMWRVLVVCGNRVLLDDIAQNLFGHNLHPYDRYVTHEHQGKFWGRSMVEDLSPCQIAVNRSLANIQQNLDLVGNPILKDNTRASVTRTQLSNKPGSRLTVGDGGDIDWLQPPSLHQDHFRLIDWNLEQMEKISGLSAITRGAVPTGRNSTDVMNAAQESSFVRIRLSLRNLEYCLRGAFTKYAQLVVRNYTVPRTVSIVGPEGERSALALRGRHFFTETENGAVPLRFNLNVSAGSQMPISPQAMAEKANFLFTAGAIDELALLQAHRWPHAEKVYARVMQQRQQMLALNPPKS